MIIHKNHKPTATHIRFRRWSRKPYAVFMGIKKNISIGTLAKGIVDKLLPKTNTLEIIVPSGTHLSLQEKSMDEVLSHELELSHQTDNVCLSAI
ncbi:MAG: hypothetical protein RR555_11750 [Bacteroidales bacterium]